MRKVLIALLIAVAGAAPITATSAALARAGENQSSHSVDVADDQSPTSDESEENDDSDEADPVDESDDNSSTPEPSNTNDSDEADSVDVADDDSSTADQAEPKASGKRDDSSSKQDKRDDREERARSHNELQDQQNKRRSSGASSDATSDASSASPSSPTSDSSDVNPDLFVGAAVSEASFPVDTEESMETVQMVAAATAGAAVDQCNGTDNIGGMAVECDVTVTNNLDLATGEESSTVEVIECHGAAGEDLQALGKCTTTTTSTNQLTTTVTQCNGSGNGGGGTVTCTVHIINNITGAVTPTAATVNQCNESGTGGGAEPTIVCDPFPANTTNATVTQCNGSGTGGGATMRVRCTVQTDSTETSEIPVTVDQCNGSGNGDGGFVTCTVSLENIIIAGDDDTPGAGDDDTPGAGQDSPDGGSNSPDGGSNSPDGGSNSPDGGSNSPDGGSNSPDGGSNSPSAGDDTPSGAGATPLGGIGGGSLARGDSQVLAAVASELSGEEALPATGLDVRVPVLLGIFMLLLGAGLMRSSRGMRPRRVPSALLTGHREDLGIHQIDLRVTAARVRELPRRSWISPTF